MAGFLDVIPEFLKSLAGFHDKLVGDITGATNKPTGVSQSVATTHGSACAASNNALAQLEATRKAAGAGMSKVSSDLATRLRIGSTQYETTDQTAADKVKKIFD